MTKFHVNPETGDAGPCRAKLDDKCPFGGPHDHFLTAADARQHWESKQGGFLKGLRAKKVALNFIRIGTVSVAAVSLAGCTGVIDYGTTIPDQGSGPVISQEHDGDQPGATDPNAGDEMDQLWESIKEDLNKLLDEEGNYTSGPSTNPVDPADTSHIMWQGGPLQPTDAEIQQAYETLDRLVVQPERDVTGQYDRAELYGRAFETGLAGRIEHRDVPNATFKNDSPQARVVDGYFHDPYTGELVHVVGGQSYDADIDHVVPLKEAFESETRPLSEAERRALANDFDNLVYVGSGVNRSKGDKDAAQWLPSYEPGQCAYVVQQILVKGKYDLAVDSAEKAAMLKVLNTRC